MTDANQFRDPEAGGTPRAQRDERVLDPYGAPVAPDTRPDEDRSYDQLRGQRFSAATEASIPTGDATWDAENGATRTPDPAERSYQRYKAEDRSLGEIASDVLDNASTLVKQEIALAKAEAKQSATRAGKGVGLLAGAGVAAFLALIALTLALWWGFALLFGTRQDPSWGVGGVTTMVLWLVIAAVLAFLGKSALDKVNGLPKTAETVSKIPNAATGNEEKNR